MGRLERHVLTPKTLETPCGECGILSGHARLAGICESTHVVLHCVPSHHPLVYVAAGRGFFLHVLLGVRVSRGDWRTGIWQLPLRVPKPLAAASTPAASPLEP